MKEPINLKVNVEDMSINQKLVPGKVVVLVLDGNKGTAKYLESPDHGSTIIETVKGKSAKVKFESGYLI